MCGVSCLDVCVCVCVCMCVCVCVSAELARLVTVHHDRLSSMDSQASCRLCSDFMRLSFAKATVLKIHP